MSGVNADPEALDTFAQSLQGFASDTRSHLQHLHAALQDMGNSTWRDSRYQEFDAMFAEVQGMISRALDSIEGEQVPHLHGLAEQLRQYL